MSVCLSTAASSVHGLPASQCSFLLVADLVKLNNLYLVEVIIDNVYIRILNFASYTVG